MLVALSHRRRHSDDEDDDDGIRSLDDFED